jgi:hypothetical protein
MGDKMKIICIGYILFWVGIGFGSIGSIPTNCEAFDWKMPLVLAIFLAPAAISGYFAGKVDAENDRINQ